MNDILEPTAKERLPAMVVSHERSGTHFLINSIAQEFGYTERHIAFDPPVVNINFFSPPTIKKFFVEHRATRPGDVRKSHHQFSFFQPVFDTVIANAHVFYIYRDPRDVLHSFRHFLNSWAWFEGPKVAEASAFIRAAPAGQMLRYQFYQTTDMLERWRVHVDGWIDAASRYDAITLVKYEDLKMDFDGVMTQIADKKGWRRAHGQPPEIDQKTVLKSKNGDPTNRYSAEDLLYFEHKIGPSMRRLGYII